MNIVSIIGRLTRDPEVRYTQDQLAVASFSVAIDRGKDKNGNDRGADFPRITVFGRQAENCGKYLKKGKQVGITGRITTGSYTNKNGEKVYTTEITADRVEFIGSKDEEGYGAQNQQQMPAGFESIQDDSIPF